MTKMMIYQNSITGEDVMRMRDDNEDQDEEEENNEK